MNISKKIKLKNKAHNMYTTYFRNSPEVRRKAVRAYTWQGRKELREALEKAKSDIEEKVTIKDTKGKEFDPSDTLG